MDELATLWNEANEAAYLDDRVERGQRLQALMAGLEHDAESLVLRGYLEYMHPDRRYARDAGDSFARALALDPHHPVAHAYIGHLLYDDAKYEAAARAFDCVEEQRLPLGPAGLDDLAILEMRACCAIHTGGWLSATSAVERYASLCEASSPFHIHPLNLCKCAQTYPVVPADAHALLARIDAAATTPWFAELVRGSARRSAR